MAFTYTGNPALNPRDAVRFLIGDTNGSDVLLQDGEIDYVLSNFNDSPVNAAIQCIEGVMAKFSRLTDEKVGLVDIKFSQKKKQYADMLVTLRQRLAVTDANPFAGGISRSQKYANDQNCDNVKPDFKKHQMENHQNSSFESQGENGDGPEE